MELTEDYAHLAEDHPDCRFEEPGSHGCSCHLDAPCGACEQCPAWNNETWEAGSAMSKACATQAMKADTTPSEGEREILWDTISDAFPDMGIPLDGLDCVLLEAITDLRDAVLARGFRLAVSPAPDETGVARPLDSEEVRSWDTQLETGEGESTAHTVASPATTRDTKMQTQPSYATGTKGTGGTTQPGGRTGESTGLTEAEMRTRPECEHCPDGHRVHQTRGAFVASDRDGDGQPTHIVVMPTAGAHVAESDAEWIRDTLNGRSPAPARDEWPDHWTKEDKLRDLHARYHSETGNLLDRDECGWERCEFWDAASFVVDAFVERADHLEPLPVTEEEQA